MPVVTPFGEVFLKDPVSIEKWANAHDHRHMVYASEGVGVGGDLSSPIDGDWMARHLSRHVTIAQSIKADLTSADINGLSLNNTWQSEQELQDWHELHNRLHQFIDKQLQIAGVNWQYGTRPVPPTPVPPGTTTPPPLPPGHPPGPRPPGQIP